MILIFVVTNLFEAFRASKWVIVLLLSVNVTFGQSSDSKSQVEDLLEISEELLEKWPDAKFAKLTSTKRFSFNRGNNLVSAISNVQEEVVALEGAATYMNGVSFDEKSSISEFKTLSSRGKKRYSKTSIDGLEIDGIFHSDAMLFSYAVPFYKKGETKKIQFDKEYSDVRYLCTVYFQTNIPTQEQKIVFEVPPWLKVDLLDMNFEGHEIIKSSEKDSGTNNEIITYTLENISPFKSESMAPSRAKQLPHIVFLAKETDGSEELFSSVDDLYSWYRSLVKEVDNDISDFKPLVEDLVARASSDMEKIENIYYWVQDNIKYLAIEDGIMGFKPENAQTVFYNKYGDCKGMANLTTEMLKFAGFDARLTWIGTNDIPYDYSVPSLAVDNHMICTVLLHDQKLFLDSTEKYISIKNNAFRIQGRPVLIEDGDEFLLASVPDSKSDVNSEIRVDRLKLNEDELLGTSERSYNGESKQRLLYGLNSTKFQNRDVALRDFLKVSDANFNVLNVEVENLDNRSESTLIRHDWKCLNQVTNLGSELYVSVEPGREFVGLKFEEDRKNNIEFSSKINSDRRVELEIPAGYKVSYLPNPIAVSNEFFKFDLSYNVAEGFVIYRKKLVIHHAVIPIGLREAWNDTLNRLKAFYSDQIIFTKE